LTASHLYIVKCLRFGACFTTPQLGAVLFLDLNIYFQRRPVTRGFRHEDRYKRAGATNYACQSGCYARHHSAVATMTPCTNALFNNFVATSTVIDIAHGWQPIWRNSPGDVDHVFLHWYQACVRVRTSCSCGSVHRWMC
jgi:hypothetical protein